MWSIFSIKASRTIKFGRTLVESIEKKLIANAVACADNESFGRLVKIYQSPIRGFLRRLTKGNHSLADDLAQDSFLTSFRKISTFRNEGTFQGWLFQIAYRSFLMHKRKRAEDQLSDDVKDDDQVESGLSQIMKLDIERAMTDLSADERASLTLCFTYGMSHGEAANILDYPLGTVKSHITRGKAKLKVSLASWQKEVVS